MNNEPTVCDLPPVSRLGSKNVRPHRRRVQVAALVVSLLAVTACSVSVEEAVTVAPSLSTLPVSSSGEVAVDDIAVLGPIPGFSHWHAAYVVRICDEVLAPFDSAADPLGIHSHGDGLMHVHPFFEESGYEDAKLGVFADAMDFSLSDGELTLPNGETYRDGDDCGVAGGRVFVDRWSDNSPDATSERFFTNLEDLRYLADGELYQIAFAPEDSPPVLPPSAAQLDQVSNLDRVIPEPWVPDVSGSNAEQVRVWPVTAAYASPCDDDAVPERRLTGEAGCLVPGDLVLTGAEAIASARPVLLNRELAVELLITPELRTLVRNHFGFTPDQPLALAIEVDGEVIFAPQLGRLPQSEARLVLAGGLTEETAIALAQVLNS